MNPGPTVRIFTLVLPLFFLLSGCKCAEKTRAPEPAPKLEKLVAHEQLAALLPKLQGWEGGKPLSAISKRGQNEVSQASASYEKKVEEQTQTVTIELIDAEHDPSVFAPLAIMVHSGEGAESGHKRGIEIQGFHGIEEWQVETQSVLLALVVGNRFLVRLSGSHVPEATVKEWMNAIDLKKLASLVKPPAQP